MTTKFINLYVTRTKIRELIQKIKKKKQDEGRIADELALVLGRLYALESHIQKFDDDVKRMFNSKELVEKMGLGMSNDERKQFVTEKKQDYAELAAGLRSQQGVASFSDAVIKARQSKSADIIEMETELLQIRDDLDAMIKYIPDESTLDTFSNGYRLYTQARALGGFYIQISQSILPACGAEEKEDASTKEKEVEASNGICGGMVLQWAEESVTNGTPHYPITSSLDVLDRQIHQHGNYERKFVNLATDLKSKDISDFNTEFLACLAPNVPHYIVTATEDGRSSHAIGVRQHENHVEIFDPNHGYFFFRDNAAAAAWFATLIQDYQVGNFPSDVISVYAYDIDPDAVPKSSFPEVGLIQDASITPYTDSGYKKLTTSLRKHIDHIISSTRDDQTNKKPFQFVYEWVCHAINQHAEFLKKEDRKKLANTLSALSALYDYDESIAVESVLPKSLYDELINQIAILHIDEQQDCRNALQACAATLNDYVPDKKQTPESAKLIEDVKKTVETAQANAMDMQREITKLEEAIEKEIDESKRQSKIDEKRVLTLKRDIYNERIHKLRKKKIVAKLTAKEKGLHPYTVADAERDFAAAAVKMPDNVAASEKLLTQVEKLQAVIHTMDQAKLEQSIGLDVVHHPVGRRILEGRVVLMKLKIEAADVILENIKKLIPYESQAHLIQSEIDKVKAFCPVFIDIKSSDADADIVSAILSADKIEERYIPEQIEELSQRYDELVCEENAALKSQIANAIASSHHDEIVERLRALDRDRENVAAMILDMVDPSLPRIAVSIDRPAENTHQIYNMVDECIAQNAALDAARVQEEDRQRQADIERQRLADARALSQAIVSANGLVNSAPHTLPQDDSINRDENEPLINQIDINDITNENLYAVLVDIINDTSGYWKSKVHFSRSEAPEGILAMRRGFTESQLKNVALRRQSKGCFLRLFTGFDTRDHVTSALYHLCSKLDGNGMNDALLTSYKRKHGPLRELIDDYNRYNTQQHSTRYTQILGHLAR